MKAAHDEYPEDNTALWEELKKRADRIEALEAALQIIAETANYLADGNGVVGDLEKIARAALAPEQDK
jgi:hypothetical protein